MRNVWRILVLVPFLAAGCGKKNAAVLPDTWEVSLARAGEAWIAKDLARTWALCENAFTAASSSSPRTHRFRVHRLPVANCGVSPRPR